MGYQPKYDIHGNKAKSPPMTRLEKAETVVAILFMLAFIFGVAFGIADFLIYMSEHQ